MTYNCARSRGAAAKKRERLVASDKVLIKHKNNFLKWDIGRNLPIIASNMKQVEISSTTYTNAPHIYLVSYH